MYDRTQTLSAEEEKYKTTRRESAAIALRLKPQNEYEIPEYYPAFLDMLKSLLDGNMDATTYEDKLRDMYGIHAYIAFTLDRVSYWFMLSSEQINSNFTSSGCIKCRSSITILRYRTQCSRVLRTVSTRE
jgi:paired amphipathic helix protein Sin3a